MLLLQFGVTAYALLQLVQLDRVILQDAQVAAHISQILTVLAKYPKGQLVMQTEPNSTKPFAQVKQETVKSDASWQVGQFEGHCMHVPFNA